MSLKQITEEFLVAGQLTAQDIAQLAGIGIRTIICNRPDGEAADQPGFEEIHQAAEAHNLKAHYLPIRSGAISEKDVRLFSELLSNSTQPVLAYCRTGTRCTILWSLAQADHMSMTDILEKTRAAGYQIAGLEQRIASAGKSSAG